MIELSLRTNSAGRQHDWCGGLTPFVLGINISVEKGREVAYCQDNNMLLGIVYRIV